MKANAEEIEINGVKYVPKGSAKQVAVLADYCIVRTYSAGVFAGNLIQRDGKEGVVANARRLWYWKGAASLSQLAVEGVRCPSECKFAMEVPRVELTEIIEVIRCTQAAFDNIRAVPIWKE